ncbi:hypothetical protein EGI16_06415 [Chryseobacterium sp. G0240]|uniref:winged helix-turn-helix transcriptional regulator n=1 Tax=Chryseobacterium sp. G0240 TaxID=2487066 RepID=UPI000F4530B4|nr:winged helix-turn-helix transcriptional regulator [Chryseobacterium sp. G0240]ROI05194.1 hypothetical protein EGI16_06415 [Chryseobacterium sp. G0240]
MIARKVITDYPAKIEYSVTDYGLGLEEIAGPLENRGKKNKKNYRKIKKEARRCRVPLILSYVTY